MRLTIAAVTIALALAGCVAQGGVRPRETFTTRELTPEEKRALAPIIADTLKDPEAARFKWMPVVRRERDGITDYCGLLNGKNSYGGYTGYTRFYGQLTKDALQRLQCAQWKSQIASRIFSILAG